MNSCSCASVQTPPPHIHDKRPTHECVFYYSRLGCAQVVPTFFSECKHLIDMMAPKPTAAAGCADDSAAIMSMQTHGRLADCAGAKIAHLCELDPPEATVMCPVTCALSCGASTASEEADGFGALVETCKHMPVQKLIDAIARAKLALRHR